MDVFFNAKPRLKHLVNEQIQALAQKIPSPKRILIKPNWVLHETDSAFPIEALVTDSNLIDAIIEASLRCFPEVESILVGDCPLQYADWNLMSLQCGLDKVKAKYESKHGNKIAFKDLRKEVYTVQNGVSFLNPSGGHSGDPRGYREVNLGSNSHLAEIASQWKSFAVNDYSNATTSSNHKPGAHKYFVSQSILDSDLFINVPKWKSHCKSAITCALKNLVGINGDKAYLPHFRKGSPKWGGDEFTDENRWLYFAQTRLREKFQKRNALAFKILKPGWEALKSLYGIETRLTNTKANPRRFYIAGGGWHGNDTVWRMIYDLNYVIQCMDSQGVLHDKPQRNYFCVVDGIISGEGNGPLQPIPRETNCLAFGMDPFLIDLSLAWFMGFEPSKIPLLAQRNSYLGPAWGKFEKPFINIDGRNLNLFDCNINFKFIPAPGWRGQIER